MSLQRRDVIQIFIAKRLYENDISQEEERLVALYLSGCMLWPYKKQDKVRYFYYALCFREIFAALEKSLAADMYLSLQSSWVKDIFGSFAAYTQLLAAHQVFPAKGKGALPERAWMGSIAGWMFKLALRDGCSLNEAAQIVAEDIRKNRQDNEYLLSPSADNIIKNYWPEFSPVAHLWGALELFTLHYCAKASLEQREIVRKLVLDYLKERNLERAKAGFARLDREKRPDEKA